VALQRPGHAQLLRPDITTCSLDDPEAAAPEDHTWTHERLSWLCTADALPRYPNSRAGGQNE
jgi:hypothetical protein